MIVKSHASNGLTSSMESKLEGVRIHRLPRPGCRSRDSVPRYWVWVRLVLVQQFFDSGDSKENMTFSTLCKAKRLSHSQSFSSLAFSSSFEYFGTLGVHRVGWLGPSLVRFAATNCQAGEILNQTEIHNKKGRDEKVSQWVLSFFCLIVCAIVGIFSTRQDTLQELHRKLQSLEERLEEELLKTGKALRKDFREDTERWGDDFRVLKRVDPNIDSGHLPNK